MFVWIKKIIFFVLLSLLIGGFFFDSAGLFIRHADYAFSLQASDFVESHVYLWSTQSGSLSIDTTIRFFARLPYLLVYSLYQDNVVFSYIFGLSNLVMIYAAGYVFVRWFLEVKSSLWRHLLSLFLIVNPVFLGNFSKLGLLFAAGILLCLLTATKYLFRTHTRAAYWFWASLVIILVNFSFVHPFNFLLNVAVFAVVFGNYAWRRWSWVRPRILWILQSILLGVASNVYILASVLASGSLDKSVLGNSIGESAEELFLLNIANNKSLFESLILAKSVFVEYEFFPEGQQAVYLFGIGCIYLSLGLLFLVRAKSLFARYKPKFFGFVLLYLVCILITTGALYSWVGEVYSFVYESLPGGWAFRSPLKFQLYLPLILVVLYGLLLKTIPRSAKQMTTIAAIVLVCGSVLSSSYLLGQIYTLLLVPESFAASDLEELDYETFRGRDVLFVNSEECRENKELYPEQFGQLRHYFNSRDNSFTLLNEEVYEERAGVYENFDFIVRCRVDPLGVSGFSLLQESEQFNFSIWQNNNSRPLALASVATLTRARFPSADEIALLREYGVEEYVYSEDLPKRDPRQEISMNTNLFFDIYDQVGEQAEIPEEVTADGYFLARNYPDLRYELNDTTLRVFSVASVELYPEEFSEQEFFEGPVPGDGVRVNEVSIPLRQGEHKLASLNKDVRLELDDTELTVPAQLRLSNSGITEDNNPFALDISDYYTLQVKDSRLGFEEGTWTEEVRDCFDYDEQPDITMALDTETVREGQQSLYLTARRHNACTELSFAVEPEDTVDLAIPYYTSATERFVYQVSFNDPEKTTERGVHYAENLNVWSEAQAQVDVPLGATEATLRLEVPQGLEGSRNEFYFDDLKITQNPRLAGRFFYTQNSLTARNESLPLPSESRYSPVRAEFEVQGVPSGNYLLTWQENYHPGWTLEGYTTAPHLRSRGLRNGWVVDIEDYCQTTRRCTSLGDGTYNVVFEVRFGPQRIYSWSVIVSGAVLLSLSIYLVWWLTKGIYLAKSKN